MREIEDAKRVLMIVDEGYVERADNYPDSGVGRETKTIQDVVDDRPNNWLSVLFVRNEKRLLPKWMEGRDPKYLISRIAIETALFPVPSRLMIYGDG
ncbi:MAG: hypothetical protein ACLSVD_00710 [Eggerthellaceae bacterium]